MTSNDESLVDDVRSALRRTQGLAPVEGSHALRTDGDCSLFVPLGQDEKDRLLALREQVTDELAVFVDTTSLISSVKLTQGTALPSAVTLLDLGAIVNAIVFYDRVYYLGPLRTSWCDDVGLWINEQCERDVFHPLETAGADGLTDPEAGNALHLLFEHGSAQLSAIFDRPESSGFVEPAPNCWDEETTTILSFWRAISGYSDLKSSDIYDAKVSTFDWQSSGGAWAAWLLAHLSDADDPSTALYIPREDQRERFRESVTEVHLRALFNAILSFHILERPYRCSVLRSPWTTQRAARSQAVARLLTTEALFEEVVRTRKVQFQLPSPASLLIPSMMALVLRDAARPDAIWRLAADLRDQFAPFRRKHAKILRVLLEGENEDDQRYAHELIAALQDGVPNTLSADVNRLVKHSVAIVPRVVGAATGADVVGMLALLGTQPAAGWIGKLARRILQPELHVASQFASEAAAMLAALRASQRIWNTPEHVQRRMEDTLQRMATLH